MNPMNSRGGTDSGGRGWIAWTAASAACILTAVIAVVFLAGGFGQATTQPSAEIYFPNPSSIASWTGAQSVSFTFEVHNLANGTHPYQYEIRVAGQENLGKLIASQTVTLEPDQSIAIKETLKPPNAAKFQVSVSLVGAKNVIYFWTQAPASHSARAKN